METILSPALQDTKRTQSLKKMPSTKKWHWGKTIASFLLVLCTMPLGHALMKVMESNLKIPLLQRHGADVVRPLRGHAVLDGMG